MNTNRQQSEVRSVTVASYNVHFGENTTALGQLFKTHPQLKRADIILLQEIEHHPHEGASRTAKIAHALGYEYRYAPARAAGRQGTHGIATLSRFPIADSQTIRLIHFKQPFSSRPRVALLTTVEAFGERILICNAHLDVRLNIQKRIEQMKPVLETIEHMRPSRVIVGGDLNTVPVIWLSHNVPIPILYRNQYQRKAMEHFLASLNYRSCLAAVSYTLKRWFFKTHLDGLFVRGLEILNSGMESAVKLSDHHPVWTNLSFVPIPHSSEDST